MRFALVIDCIRCHGVVVLVDVSILLANRTLIIEFLSELAVV